MYIYMYMYIYVYICIYMVNPPESATRPMHPGGVRSPPLHGCPSPAHLPRPFPCTQADAQFEAGVCSLNAERWPATRRSSSPRSS